MATNSKLKIIQITRKGKPFQMPRIQESSSCTSKETVEIDILIKSRNVGRKTMQPTEMTSEKMEYHVNMEMKPLQSGHRHIL